MTKEFADQEAEGQTNPNNVKTLSLGWMIGFVFAVSFVGLFSIVCLRKIMIIDNKLTFPSGTATAHLINSFHTPQGARIARKQVAALFKSCGVSFFWSFFQWFYTGGSSCGFRNFPSLGLEAFKKTFYFDFSVTYVGVGMICPYIVNISLLLGGILSWGILWPFIESKKGHWFPADLAPNSLRGEKGYKVFIPTAMILGDGLFNFLIVAFRTTYDMYQKCKNKDAAVISMTTPSQKPTQSARSYDEEKRTKAFLQDQIPTWVACVGYLALALVSIATVPSIFHQIKFYHVIISYLVAPVLAFCNSYGAGLTDWSLATNYGKLAVFAFSAWVGMANGGIVASLAACGVMLSIVSTAADLMQDFRTGYLTLASPRAMFASQVVGTTMGCIIAPCTFWIFFRAFPIGRAGSLYPAPLAALLLSIAMIGADGFSTLPNYCLRLCAGFFFAAFGLSAMREWAKYKKWKVHKYLPYAMGMAVPFFSGAAFTIDMCIGSLVLYLWERLNKQQADSYALAVASGMICGEAMWSLPSSLLSIAKVKPPICMMFFPSAEYDAISQVLGG